MLVQALVNRLVGDEEHLGVPTSCSALLRTELSNQGSLIAVAGVVISTTSSIITFHHWQKVMLGGADRGAIDMNTRGCLFPTETHIGYHALRQTLETVWMKINTFLEKGYNS